MRKGILSNTIYLYILTFVKMFFPLIMLPFLTRVLSVETYGVVTYVKSYISYVQLALDFGFLLSATKEISLLCGKDDKRINYIIGNTIVEKCFITIVMAILTFILSYAIPILRDYKTFTWLYFLAISMNIFVADYLFRGIEKMGYIAIPYTIAKTLSLIFTILFVKSDANLIFIPLFEMAGNLFASVISVYLIYKVGYSIKIGKPCDWIKDIKESAVYFISNFATTVFGSLTTIIGGIYLTLSEVSYWGLAMQVVTAAKSMYTPISNSIYPYMIRSKDIRLIKRICVLMLLPMLLGSILVLGYGNQILSFVAGSDYYPAGDTLKLLLPVIIASFYSMIFGWPVLGAIGKIKETTITTIVAAVIQLTIMLLLILFKWFNLTSLSICCGIAEVSLLLMRYVIYKRNKALW